MNEMEDGLRILARIIARAYMEREGKRLKEEAENQLLSDEPSIKHRTQATS